MSARAVEDLQASGAYVAGLRRRIELLLVVTVLVVFAPIVSHSSAQPDSRYSLTAALSEHGSVDLEPYAGALDIDKALYRGELRSDKAPGQPLFGVPFYLAARAAGAESAAHRRVEGNLGLWWQTLWSSVLPFAALLVLMQRVAARLVSRHALAATLALGFGTALLPYSVNLYGQVLAALLAFGTWIVVRQPAPSNQRLLIGGALAGAAVTVEYHTAIVALVVAIVCAVRARRRALWFVAGALPPIALLASYQWTAFGAPWRLPYAYYVSGAEDGGFHLPTLSDFVEVIADDHGLLSTMPIVLVALFAAALGARRGGVLATDCRVALAVGAAYIVMSAAWSGISLSEDPGPRYLTPSLPFLVAPTALALGRWRPLTTATVAIGATTALLASFCDVITPATGSPLGAGIEEAARGDFAATLWSLALGRLGVALYLITVVAVAAAWYVTLRRPAHQPCPTFSPSAGDSWDTAGRGGPTSRVRSPGRVR